MKLYFKGWIITKQKIGDWKCFHRKTLKSLEFDGNMSIEEVKKLL